MGFTRQTPSPGHTEKATSGTSVTHTLATTVSAGRFIIAMVVAPNQDGIEDSATTHWSIEDSQSNTWNKLGEYSFSSSATTGVGICMAAFWSVLDTQLTVTTDTITASADYTPARCQIATDQYSFTGSSVQCDDVTFDGNISSSVSLSITSGTISSIERLWFGGHGWRYQWSGGTFDPDYTGRWLYAISTEQSAVGGNRIATLTSDTFTSTDTPDTYWSAFLAAFSDPATFTPELSVDPGAFTVTGTAATLTKSSGAAYELTATAGAYAVTGTAATLTGGQPYYYGEAHYPPDTGSISGPGPLAVTPPSSMRESDLVLFYGHYRNELQTLSISETGGQTWVSETKTSNVNNQTRLFWCRFNGTWSANPSIVASGLTEPMSVWMVVFRATNTSKEWERDILQAVASGSISTDPQDITITSPGSTTVGNAVIGASWSLTLARTLGLQTAGWSNPGSVLQLRNYAGNDQTLGLAYQIKAVAGAVGDVTEEQTGSQYGYYATSIIAFREVAGGVFQLTADPGSVAVTGTAATLLKSGSATITADAGAVTVTGTDVDFGVVVQGDAGAVTVTGTSALLATDPVLQPTAGAFTVTGTNATLQYIPMERWIDPLAGTYLVTGTNAGLVYSGAVTTIIKPNVGLGLYPGIGI